MKVKDTLFTLEGDCLVQDIDDSHAAMSECYYYGTVNAIVDLMRLYGFDSVMKDIKHTLSQWDEGQ